MLFETSRLSWNIVFVPIGVWTVWGPRILVHGFFKRRLFSSIALPWLTLAQLQVYNRPNPQIEIGNVDSAVALTLCDAEDSNHPIVYCSEPFQALTGYSSPEVIGQNCRFLQTPPGSRCSDRNILQANSAAKREVKHNISRGRESRVRFTNFKKDGTPFTNILTVIPIFWEGKNYIVGFQADEGSLYR